jgi:plasmid maintenance system antidote protein VapI
MISELEILKGIHPGFVLERKIKERHLKKRKLALAVREYPQTLTAITKGNRDMNTSLAMKLENELGLEEGYFMTLQIFYEIKQQKQKNNKDKPDLSKLRPALFWDTKIESINWKKQNKAVIRRTYERGNLTEKKEIMRFYSAPKIRKILNEDKLKKSNRV